MNQDVTSIIYFADRSNISPLIISTIKFKMLGLPNFLLQNVLYLPKLWRSLFSFVQLRQQAHSIDMVEIRRSSNNNIVMIGWEDEKLLKLKGAYAKYRHFMYLIEKGTVSSSLLWHCTFWVSQKWCHEFAQATKEFGTMWDQKSHKSFIQLAT